MRSPLPTRNSKKRAQGRRTSWLVALLVVTVAAGLWWLWQQQTGEPPRLDYLSLRVNQEVRRLLPGEALTLHPYDTVEIVSVSTNCPFNRNVRLTAEGFDVNALWYGPLPLVDLLPRRDPFDRYSFVIHVKQGIREMAQVVWVVEPYAEDWLEKADRIIDPGRRIALLERALGLVPDDKRIRHRLLEEYKAQKEWKKAASLLEEKKGGAEDGAALEELLRLYQEMGDTGAEMGILKELVRLNPDDIAIRRRYAERLEDAQDRKGAIREYEALATRVKEADRIDLFKHLGYLYAENQEYEKAIGAYLEAAKIDQKDANLHYNISHLYEKLGEREKADFYLNNAVTLAPGDLEGRRRLADHLMERGDTAGAKKHLSDILEQKPDDLRSLGLMAQILEKEGDRAGLKAVYQKILSINPREDIILYNLGAIEYEAGNLKEALPYFQEYLTSHPEDANAHAILFDIYRRLKESPSALREAMVLADLRPTDPDIYEVVVEVMGRQGDYKGMIPLLQKGIKANPHEVGLQRYLIAAYLKTGQEDLAIRQTREILSQRPADVRPLIQDLFEHLKAKGAYDRLIGILKEAVEAFPQDPVFRGYLVFAYLETGKEAEAMAQMEAILKLRPKDRDIWLQLARLKEKLNDLPGAAKAYERVLEISPDHREASEAYLRLRLNRVGQGDKE